MGLLDFAGDGGSSNVYSVLALSGTLAVILLSIVYDSVRRTYGSLPPGPRNWPIVGAMFSLEPMQGNFAQLAKKYGPIVYFKLGIQPLVWSHLGQ
jgi:hypothetical protein